MGMLVLSELTGTFEFQADSLIGVYKLLTPHPHPSRGREFWSPSVPLPSREGVAGMGIKKEFPIRSSYKFLPANGSKSRDFIKCGAETP